MFVELDIGHPPLGIVFAPRRPRCSPFSRTGKARIDGGWSTASLGHWKRSDGTPVDTQSDGYATGLAILALERGGVSRSDARVQRGLDWLVQHQDSATGAWSASSLNKSRDPKTDIGKFMIDAATAYAVLALTQNR